MDWFRHCLKRIVICLVIPFLLVSCQSDEDSLPTSLVVMDADSNNQRVVLSDPTESYWGPAWSPNGAIFSFISQEESDINTSEIYIIHTDGTNGTHLTENEAWEYGTSWSLDGQTIVFGSERNGRWQIYSMDPDGNKAVPIIMFKGCKQSSFGN